MKLPQYDRALVPREKITDYLLSETHLDGRHKARFFTLFGFVAESWEILAEALRQHAAAHEVARVEDSPFGMRYVVEGIITTPAGRTPLVRSVWFVRHGEETPRFVTAYPLPERTVS
jgi:hypothetical protein